MSNPRSSRITLAFALTAALLTSGVVASTASLPLAGASVGAGGAVPRSVTDDTVLGTFTPMGGGVTSFVDSLAVQGDDTVYAGGNFASASGVPGTGYIAAWSNVDDTWHSLASGTTGRVRALAVVGDDTVYAGGGFAAASGVPNTSRIAAWSNADDTWRALSTGMVSNTVYGLALRSDDTLYAGGDFLSASGVLNTRRIAQWSSAGDTWSPAGGGPGSGQVRALATQGDDTIYAAGTFTAWDVVPNTRGIAAWSQSDGAWHSVGGGVDDEAYALATQADDTMYVGGHFDFAGGVAGTQRIAAWSHVDDTWHALGAGTNDDVLALDVDSSHGLVYAGGDFTAAGSLSGINQVAVWDTGLATWLPLQAPGGVGVASSVNAIAANGSVVYLGGAFTTAGGVSASRIAKWTWGAPTAAAVPATGGNSTTIQVRGSRLIGVSGVRINGSLAAYTRDDSTTVSVAIPSNLYDGTYSIQVDAVGGTATTTYTVTGAPAPRPPEPPNAPNGVAAVAGDASATVSWTAPSDSGSYAISTYQATSTPGGKSCLASAPALTCDVTGLTNGTAYTFTVRALNGAGWGTASTPSDAVTPRAPARPVIVIAGSRSGSVIGVAGTSTGLGMGEILQPWVRFPGQPSATRGVAEVLVDATGSFTWQRRASKTSHVYFANADGSARSNTVTIPAR